MLSGKRNANRIAGQFESHPRASPVNYGQDARATQRKRLFQYAIQFSAGNLPQNYGSIAATDRQYRSVRGKSQRINPVKVTPERRANLLAKMESSKNCRYFETQVEARDVLGITADSKDIVEAVQCHREQDALRDGGETQAYFSLARYLAINGAIALAGSLGVLGLALVLPVLLRHYRLRPTSQS